MEEHCDRRRKGTPHILADINAPHDGKGGNGTREKEDKGWRQVGTHHKGKGGPGWHYLHKENSLRAQKSRTKRLKIKLNRQSQRQIFNRRERVTLKTSHLATTSLFSAVASCPTRTNKEQVRIRYSISVYSILWDIINDY